MDSVEAAQRLGAAKDVDLQKMLMLFVFPCRHCESLLDMHRALHCNKAAANVSYTHSKTVLKT